MKQSRGVFVQYPAPYSGPQNIHVFDEKVRTLLSRAIIPGWEESGSTAERSLPHVDEWEEMRRRLEF